VPNFTWPDRQRAAVSLTFDDARDSQLDHGAPILAKHGTLATFYVSLGPLQARASEWVAMSAAGHEIGNHTTTHPCTANNEWSRDNGLEDHTLATLEQDIDGAAETIERVIGTPATTFAYPCGDRFVGRGERTQSYVPLIARRFLAGRGYPDETYAAPSVVDLAQVPGITMDGVPIERLTTLVEVAIELGSWLVLVAHDVEVSTTPPGPDPDLTIPGDVLDTLCGTLAADSRVWCASVRDVAGYVAAHRGG